MLEGIYPPLNALYEEGLRILCRRRANQSKNDFVVLQERPFNFDFPPLYSYKMFLRRPAILWNTR